jgi:hypothetical protein
MSIGQTVSQLLYVAAKLGIADMLQSGSRHVSDLAQALELDRHALQRVMRALASLGIFVETEPQQFAMTKLAAPLATDYPSSVRYWVIMVGEQWHRRAWDEILYSVKTGKPGFQRAFGMGTFEYFAHNPQDSAVFNQAMRSLTAGQSEAIAAAYNLSTMRRVVDVGGGSGALLASILQANPGVNGTLST